MLPLGHVAAALLASDIVDGDGPTAAIASQVPDLIDKSLAWVFGVTESSRFLGHTLLAAALFSSIAWAVGGRRTMSGVAAGYATHLVGDQVFGGKVPFLWPLKRYRLGHKAFRLKPRSLLIELVAAGYLYRRLAVIRKPGS